ncbi:MAG: cysteine desulfurase [Rhodothermaceae bacterium]|nr:cysteine desulfurase [Rhodothermaceae bacterium]
MKLPIYLDYNATTPVDQRVVEKMLPFFTQHFGNASSKGHAFGWAAAEAVQQAREQMASALQAQPEEVYFTGGATESINTAIKGVAATYARKGNHIITVRTEHKAVLEACQHLEKQGCEVTYLNVNSAGLIDLGELEAALTDRTILVCVMWANNETGVIQPISDSAMLAKSKDALFMTDGTQALGKVPVSVENIDLFACTAHKLFGPKGIGAMYIRKKNPRVRVIPLIHGGSQEDGKRAGTLNVPGIVGFGAATEMAISDMENESSRLLTLRDGFEQAVTGALSGVQVNGKEAPRLPHVSNIAFEGVTSANLVSQIRELAVSTGSACSTGTGKPSHVLKAMGLSDETAYSSLRISLGRFTTEEEMQFAAEKIVSSVRRLRDSHVVTNHF